MSANPSNSLPASPVTVSGLQQMKREGRKIVGVVAWDFQMARIADRAGVDIVSVGDTVGINLWGHSNPLEVTMEEMLIVTKAVRRGVKRALVSVDFPFGPLQNGTQAALDAAIRFVKEAGVDMVKLDGSADYPEAVAAIARAGIPVFAQFGITPHTALKHGVDYKSTLKVGVKLPPTLTKQLVAEAQRLEAAGACLLDFTHSGPVAGPAVTAAVKVPVVGGLGGGPWLDGRMRMANAAIGYAASTIDNPPDTYAQVAQTALDALSAVVADVRAGRQIKGGIPIGAQAAAARSAVSARSATAVSPKAARSTPSNPKARTAKVS
jgi:3-methyl-2-oxobutanoate hydroxymethyltransferase